jgi:hypothetical protein
MRALRTGALLLAFSLAACGHTHTVTVKPAVAPAPPSRPLVSVPGPGELPISPLPELKPGTDVTAAPAAADTGGQAATPAAATTDSRAGTPATTGEGSQTAAPSTAAVPNAPATAPAANYDPDRLVGLSEAEATNLLGPPAEKSDSPPSRVWTYRSETCDVKLFFYPEVGGTTYRTLTYEINDRDPADTTHGGCVGGLVKAHAG